MTDLSARPGAPASSPSRRPVAVGFIRRLAGRTLTVRVTQAGVTGTITRADQAEAKDAEQAAAERETTHCRRCRKPFEADSDWDGRARYKSTPWCRSCVDTCHDGSAEHVCVICKPFRYSQPPVLRGDTIERSVRAAFPVIAAFLDDEEGETR